MKDEKRHGRKYNKLVHDTEKMKKVLCEGRIIFYLPDTGTNFGMPFWKCLDEVDMAQNAELLTFLSNGFAFAAALDECDERSAYEIRPVE